MACGSRARGRGLGLVDVIVAAMLLSFLFAYSMQVFYYERRGARISERVDNLRSVRQYLAEITRDLETATEVLLPGYDTCSYDLIFRDDRYQLVRYVITDKTGAELVTEASLHAEPDVPNYLVRVVGGQTIAQGKRIVRQCNKLHYVKFTRLGRNLLGIVVRLKKTEERPGEERTLELDTMVSLGRMLN